MTTPFDAVRDLAPVSLDELNREASLADRFDRKYIVDAQVVTDMIAAFADRLRVLEIDGDRCFAYRSTYFDTPGLRTFLDTARRRRRRFKTRVRSYVGGESFFEIKIRASRRRTIKHRVAHRAAASSIGDGGVELLTNSIGDSGLAAELVPTLVTEYERITLLDSRASARITVDLGLRCHEVHGGEVELRDLIVVETKSRGRRLEADRWLWHHGQRPVRFSKYATSLAVLRPELPRNRWTRTAPLLTIVGE